MPLHTSRISRPPLVGQKPVRKKEEKKFALFLLLMFIKIAKEMEIECVNDHKDTRLFCFVSIENIF
jgi:hypothetical protein